ncbi:unnamed protein product, partial [Amoebophrya sp. A120]
QEAFRKLFTEPEFLIGATRYNDRIQALRNEAAPSGRSRPTRLTNEEKRGRHEFLAASLVAMGESMGGLWQAEDSGAPAQMTMEQRPAQIEGHGQERLSNLLRQSVDGLREKAQLLLENENNPQLREQLMETQVPSMVDIQSTFGRKSVATRLAECAAACGDRLNPTGSRSWDNVVNQVPGFSRARRQEPLSEETSKQVLVLALTQKPPVVDSTGAGGATMSVGTGTKTWWQFSALARLDAQQSWLDLLKRASTNQLRPDINKKIKDLQGLYLQIPGNVYYGHTDNCCESLEGETVTGQRFCGPCGGCCASTCTRLVDGGLCQDMESCAKCCHWGGCFNLSGDRAQGSGANLVEMLVSSMGDADALKQR